MLIMVANNTGAEARRLAAAFPDRIGNIVAPGGWRRPIGPYALDNGAYTAWRAGRPVSPAALDALCEQAAQLADGPPRWVVVPDAVADADGTLRLWHSHAPRLRAAYGWPLAFAVQDGMQAGDVPRTADAVFVGGTTAWKWATVAAWCAVFPGRVHVGRVNTERLLWQCHRAGAASCDGSGWFRGDRAQLDGLWYFLTDTAGLDSDPAHGPMQRRLFPREAA